MVFFHTWRPLAFAAHNDVTSGVGNTVRIGISTCKHVAVRPITTSQRYRTANASMPSTACLASASSASRNITHCPVDARNPALRAAETPAWAIVSVRMLTNVEFNSRSVPFRMPAHHRIQSPLRYGSHCPAAVADCSRNHATFATWRGRRNDHTDGMAHRQFSSRVIAEASYRNDTGDSMLSGSCRSPRTQSAFRSRARPTACGSHAPASHASWC